MDESVGLMVGLKELHPLPSQTSLLNTQYDLIKHATTNLNYEQGLVSFYVV